MEEVAARELTTIMALVKHKRGTRHYSPMPIWQVSHSIKCQSGDLARCLWDLRLACIVSRAALEGSQS